MKRFSWAFHCWEYSEQLPKSNPRDSYQVIGDIFLFPRICPKNHEIYDFFKVKIARSGNSRRTLIRRPWILRACLTFWGSTIETSITPWTAPNTANRYDYLLIQHNIAMAHWQCSNPRPDLALPQRRPSASSTNSPTYLPVPLLESEPSAQKNEDAAPR